MKKYYLICLCTAAFISGLAGCSKSDTPYTAGMEESPEIEVNLKTPAGGLLCPLYIFRRQAGSADDYLLESAFESVTDGSTLKIPLEDLRAFDYRFLMMGQPAGTKWLDVKVNGQELSALAPWKDIRITEIADLASDEAYYGVTDMTGAEIISGGRIPMILERIAGEMVFDIYRGTSPDNPESIVSTDVASVIDRVSKIEISYANPTVSLRFGAGNVLVPVSYGSVPIIQVIKPSLNTDLKAALPQPDMGLTEYESAFRGSLRIMGAFLLPSDSKIRAAIKFTYYDTTPVCGNNHTGDHVSGCFKEKTLTLNLPPVNAVDGLPVKGNCFTINRAALHTDRIIDVPTESSVDVDFTWK